MKNFLVLDVGTTGVKGFVFNENLKLIAKSYYRLNKRFPKKGWVEQNPKELVNKSILALKKAVKESGVPTKSLVSLGITNQRETTILWDKKTGRPIYPAIVWEDTRTAARTKVLGKRYNVLVSKRTGLRIDPYFSAAKIAWILENVPKANALLKEDKIFFGTVDTWILWNLSKGKIHATDHTNASRTLLFNIQKLAWDKDLLNVFKVPMGILPQTQPSGSLFGYLDKKVIGISLPIMAMCGDQQASMYAAGTKPHTTKVTYGTGTFMMQIVGSKFVQHKSFFTTLAATTSKPVYAMEDKIDCCGDKVDELLKKKFSLVPIITNLSKQVAISVKRFPHKPKRLIVDGGLTQAPSLVPILSKATGIPVLKQPIHDGTGLGVAKLLKSLN